MSTSTMLTALVSMALAVAALGPVAAQGTDFGGTWHLDRAASEFQEFGGGRGSGTGRRGPGRGLMGAATLAITQADDLLIEQQSEQGTRTLTCHLDRRESTNASPRGSRTTTSMWDDAAIVTEDSQQLSTPRGDFSFDLIERRSLSDAGQTMTVQSTRMMPFGDVTVTLVYTKSTT